MEYRIAIASSVGTLTSLIRTSSLSFPSSVGDNAALDETAPRRAVRADADLQAVVRLRGFDGEYDEFRIVGRQVGYL
ncbi:hypothetical protein D1O30_05080 [Methylocystis hirsuta]|uniref:Uncharacterized protein n=1 Tax=Methylocystis hirsuta TaxID=369798 RepID=A0A3M9XMW7_9HYPH|nr:hypothetical protein D1O30_05080 [Methylocystis hirsuta]